MQVSGSEVRGKETGTRGALEGQEEGAGNNSLGNGFLYLSQTLADLKEGKGKQFTQEVGLSFGRHTIPRSEVSILVNKLPRDINSIRNI